VDVFERSEGKESALLNGDKTEGLMRDLSQMGRLAQLLHEKEEHKGDEIPLREVPGEKKDEEEAEEVGGLTEEERKEVERLRKRDREVRAHEMAHKIAAGGYAGQIHYEYERGPDGRLYAVGGYTEIDASTPSDPKEAAKKAAILRRAALAPGSNLSASDRRLAAAALKMAQQAQRQLAKERMAKVGMDEEEEGDAPDQDVQVDVEQGEGVRLDEISQAGGNEDQVEGSEGGTKVEELEKPISELTDAEKEQLRKLKERDREVRAHEQAHKNAAGPYVRGGPYYTYQRGPDGRRYAIGGSIVLDTSPVPGDPEETIRKARTIRRAALAPADPSAQDRKIAQEAAKMEREAREELREEKMAELTGEGSETDENDKGIKAVTGDEITPELERKILEQKRLHPEMDERDLKRWLAQTEGVDISEQEIERVLMKIQTKMLKQAMEQPAIVTELIEGSVSLEDKRLRSLEIAEGQPFSLNPIIYGSYDFFNTGINFDMLA
jgi:hypothetical protein